MDNQNYSNSTTDTNIKLEESHPDEALNYFNSGLTLYHQQKYDEAIAQFKKAIEIKPDFAYAYGNWGLALHELGRYDEAIVQYQKATEIKSDDVNTYYNWGIALHELGRYDEAIVQYQKATEIKSDYVFAYYNWGLALNKLKQYEKAIVQYQKATEIKSDDVNAYNNWGLALHELGRYDEAIVQYQRATEIKSDDVNAYYNWGIALHELGRYDEAIVQYQKATEIKSDYVFAYYNWGLALDKLKQYEKAIVQYQRVTEIKSDDVDAYNNWGLALHELGRYDEAIVQYQKATEIKSDDVDAYNNWGRALHELGRYDEAIVQYQKATEIKSDYVFAYYNWGLALNKLKQYEKAIVQYQRATEIKSDYVFAYYNWGIALHELGQYDEAIVQYQKATEIKSDDVDAYYNWGLALYELKQYEKAIVQYQRATEIKSDDVNAYYSWGIALYELKQYNEAIAQYQKATQVDADFAYAYHNLAYTLEKQGRYQEARDKWIKACQAYEKTIPSAEKNKDADSLFYYGNTLYEVLGDLKKAELIFQKGLLLNAEHPDILKQLGELYLEWHGDYPSGLDSSAPEITSAYYGKAYEYFTKASTILKKRNDDAKNSLDYLRLGELLLKIEDYDEAEKHFLDLTKQNSAFIGEANAHLGALYSMYPEKEDLRLAAQYFEKALKNDPDDLTIWSNLAEVYLRLKLMEKAETAYKKILRRARNHLDTHIGLGEFYVALAEDQDEDQYKQAIQYFTNSINLAGSPNRSKRLRDKELAAVYYSRGYARVKFYEYEKPIGDYSLLIDALADFKACFKLDKDHHKSDRAIEKIETVLNKTRHYSQFSEKVGPWFVVIPSACVFLFTQASLFFNMPHMPLVIKDTGSYLTLTFLPLLFIIIGLYLPNILRIKFPGVELEKSSIQQISTPSSLGIKK